MRLCNWQLISYSVSISQWEILCSPANAKMNGGCPYSRRSPFLLVPLFPFALFLSLPCFAPATQAIRPYSRFEKPPSRRSLNFSTVLKTQNMPFKAFMDDQTFFSISCSITVFTRLTRSMEKHFSPIISTLKLLHRIRNKITANRRGVKCPLTLSKGNFTGAIRFL